MQDTKLILLSAMIALSGCATDDASTISTEYGSDGTVLRTTQILAGNQYADHQIELTRQKCYEAKAAQAVADQNRLAVTPQDQAATIAAVNALGDALKASIGVPAECAGSTNSNDVKIVQTQERHNTVRSVVGGVAKWGAIGYGAGKAADVIGALAGSGGIEISGDNNAIQGSNTGKNGAAHYAQSTTASDEAGTICPPEYPTLRPDGLCSDGNGGEFDPDAG